VGVLDGFGLLLFYAAWVAFPAVVLVIWRQRWLYKWQRVVFGTLIGSAASALLYLVSLAICFRNGMGP
jgi:hypothetical protein